MSLKETVESLRGLLATITVDLEKAVNGNKAAAQRVRTASIRFEKVAKVYRKDSIRSEKSERTRKMSRSRNSYRGSYGRGRSSEVKKSSSKGGSSVARKATRR